MKPIPQSNQRARNHYSANSSMDYFLMKLILFFFPKFFLFKSIYNIECRRINWKTMYRYKYLYTRKQLYSLYHFTNAHMPALDLEMFHKSKQLKFHLQPHWRSDTYTLLQIDKRVRSRITIFKSIKDTKCYHT